MADDLGSHYVVVVTQILQGKVVPFLGAGANNCGRPEETSFQAGRLLPSGGELSRYLAQKYGYTKGDLDELVRVAEHVAMTAGEGALFDQLRRLFNVDYPPNPLHRLLAGLPGLLRAKGYPPQYQLVVTTNYDDVLERAFAEAGGEIDVFSYMALGQGQQGKFLHLPPQGEPVLVDSANDYRGLLLDDEDNLPRPAILKIHGAVNRTDRNRDSYVITEDHYINYLTHTDISSLVPWALRRKLTESNFLFLGYSLRDWNVRAILHRIWAEQRATYKSWAVQSGPEELDEAAWGERGAKIFDVRLDPYVEGLAKRLEEIEPAEAIEAGS